MRPVEKWIWLPKAAYPQNQTTRFSERVRVNVETNYTVASFSRVYDFGKEIAEISLRFSGDTAFALFCNGQHLANGPVLPGGDFLEIYDNEPLPQHYATQITLNAQQLAGLNEGRMEFWSLVRMMPARCFDYSRGHGGFFLTAHVQFADGTKTVVYTDNSWQAQYLPAYTAPCCFDNSLPQPEPVAAEPIMNIWNCETAPIPPCTQTRIAPMEGGCLKISAGQKVEKLLTLT